MTIYDEEALDGFNTSLSEINEKFGSLRERYILRKYHSERGKEFAHHGFCRRLALLIQALETVFETVPPDRGGIPEKEELQTMTMAIQSFVINVSGCIDNLAWIWAYENDICDNEGNFISARDVGFGNNNNRFKRTLPTGFKNYINSRRDWLDHTKNFRDSLAHRVPLYIPPHCVDPANEKQYHALGALAYDALKNSNFDEQTRLEEERKNLCHFKPIMLHSLGDNSPVVYFYSQMISDYLTVEEFSNELLSYLPKIDT